MLSATSVLLQLVAGRFDVDSVLEFLALGPVRERFGFDDDNLGVISEWVEATNVRWGLDPSQRERLGLPEVGGDQHLGGGRGAAAGRFGRLRRGPPAGHRRRRPLRGGGRRRRDHRQPGRGHGVPGRSGRRDQPTARPLAEWVERIGQTCAALFATERDQGWQLEALERILGEVLESSALGDEASSVALGVRRCLEAARRAARRQGRAGPTSSGAASP